MYKKKFNWVYSKKTPASLTPNIKGEEKKAPFRPPRHPPGPADRSQTPRPVRVTHEAGVHGFTLGHRGHSSHQQGWRFCGSFKELRKRTSTLK
ncbi:hypothetical protein N7492_001682 [Penicillium capsulatum]|uniref:Uncharacterized protein n=1 Tax=Penicillium capsulatum TaxID=69766 RepID=A0A9W9IY82_9EURO|nr:hypothetical protein N7492_001682 [Penicillium capsulatum]KAJ6129267.1 hypothetical protein N7512_002047 [Penicillium capsulatum]